jgi:hypothetical protein
MVSGSGVLTVNDIECLLHLVNIGRRASIESILHDRLFRTSRTTKGGLQGGVGPQAGVKLDQAVGTSQQSDESIIEFINRAIADGLLGYLKLLADGREEIELLQFETQGRQASMRRTVKSNRRDGRLRHGDEPPLEMFSYTPKMVHHHVLVKLAA